MRLSREFSPFFSSPDVVAARMVRLEPGAIQRRQRDALLEPTENDAHFDALVEQTLRPLRPEETIRSLLKGREVRHDTVPFFL
jgi:hypothetical protein